MEIFGLFDASEAVHVVIEFAPDRAGIIQYSRISSPYHSSRSFVLVQLIYRLTLNL